jgi:hypothetical protein
MGTVAVPNNTDVWPFYYHREALALIEQKVGGKNYQIVSEGEIVTGRSTQNTQQTNTEQTANPRNPNQTGQQQTVTGSITQQNITEYRITFVRLQPGQPVNGAGMNGLPGPAQGVIQTGGPGPATGVVPSVMPNTGAPAGGALRGPGTGN